MSKKRDKYLIDYIKRSLTGLENEAKESAADNHQDYTVGAMSAVFDHVLYELSNTDENFNTLSLIKLPRKNKDPHN